MYQVVGNWAMYPYSVKIGCGFETPAANRRHGHLKPRLLCKPPPALDHGAFGLRFLVKHEPGAMYHNDVHVDEYSICGSPSLYISKDGKSRTPQIG